jgi:hypothetical protein
VRRDAGRPLFDAALRRQIDRHYKLAVVFIYVLVEHAASGR